MRVSQDGQETCIFSREGKWEKGQSRFNCVENIIFPTQNLLILKLSPRSFWRQQSFPLLVLSFWGLSILDLKSTGIVRDPSHLILLFSQELLDMKLLLIYLVSVEMSSELFGYLHKVTWGSGEPGLMT